MIKFSAGFTILCSHEVVPKVCYIHITMFQLKQYFNDIGGYNCSYKTTSFILSFETSNQNILVLTSLQFYGITHSSITRQTDKPFRDQGRLTYTRTTFFLLQNKMIEYKFVSSFLLISGAKENKLVQVTIQYCLQAILQPSTVFVHVFVYVSESAHQSKHKYTECLRKGTVYSSFVTELLGN